MLGRVVGAVRFKESLSFHTSLRIGGPAEFLIEPQDIDDVRYSLAFADHEALPVTVLGGGTSMLVADSGIPGVVLKLQGVLARIEFDGVTALVGAGVTVGALLREAAARGLGGLECLAGIPGTVGGALAMNVATAGGSMVGLCSSIYVLQPDGTVDEIQPSRGSVTSGVGVPAGGLILGCRVSLTRRPPAQIHKEIQQRFAVRKATEPLALASVGYVWQSPNGESAVRLIERAGLRGKRHKNVEISSKCANVIVNRGGATAEDVLAVLQLTRDRVLATSGIRLEPKIRILGFDPVALGPQRLALVSA